MIPSIKLLNLDLELIGLIDDYQSFYFEEKYSDIGECTLTISAFSENFKLITKNMILYLSEFQCFYIEEINIENDIAEIKALTLNFILGHRITIPPKGATHISYKNNLTGEIIKAFVKDCLITSSDKTRNINLKLKETDVGHLVDYQSRYKNLFDETKALADYSAIGFRLGINIKDKHFVFETYNGRDMTQEIIFSELYDNIDNISITDSNLSYKNFIFVAGQGEGVDRKIISVSDTSKSGWTRREDIKDSRDKEEEENLELEGEKLLAEYCEKTSIEATIFSEEDVRLGDIVTIITKKYGYQFSQRVLQIDTEYTKTTGKTVNVIIGNQKPTFTFKEDDIFE